MAKKIQPNKGFDLIKVEKMEKYDTYNGYVHAPTDSDPGHYDQFVTIQDHTMGGTEPAFRIEVHQPPYSQMRQLQYTRFATPLQAANFFYLLKQSVDLRETVKLNDSMIQFIERASRDLRDRAQKIREDSIHVHSQLWRLKEACKQAGLPESMIYSLEDCDPVAKVRELKLDGDDTPFFSEGKLYDLLGKEDARTVLAAIKRLMAAVDPIAAEARE